MIRVRHADMGDLGFVSQDGYVPPERIARKIDADEVFVAEEDRRPVGYARIKLLWSKVPYLALVRVLPGARGRGVGRALLRTIEEELRRAGHDLLLSSSQADEPEPQAWHRRMGFTDSGRIEGINDGVDEIFFRKRLPQEDDGMTKP